MDCDPPLIKAHSLFHLLKKANHPMVCQSRGIVPDLCARMGQPRQPHNIKRVKELRLNLTDPRAPSTWVDESCLTISVTSPLVMDKVPPTFLECFLYGSSCIQVFLPTPNYIHNGSQQCSIPADQMIFPSLVI